MTVAILLGVGRGLSLWEAGRRWGLWMMEREVVVDLPTMIVLAAAVEAEAAVFVLLTE